MSLKSSNPTPDAQGLLPNTFMFNAAMGAAQESGDVDALWEQMQASRVRPDAVRTVAM